MRVEHTESERDREKGRDSILSPCTERKGGTHREEGRDTERTGETDRERERHTENGREAQREKRN